MKLPVSISKGKKIVHFCNYSPIDSGIYTETRDLVNEELRVGYDAWIVDNIVNNPARLDPSLHDDLFKKERIIGLEAYDESFKADLFCWHSFTPESVLNNTENNLVMFLHGMPSHVFYNEIYGGEKVLTYLKTAHQTLPHCHAFITLWPSHKPYWENVLAEKLLVIDPIIDTRCIRLKTDDQFDPNHMKLVVVDSWRGGKEPYYIFNAVQKLMAEYEDNKTECKVTLNIYGQGQDKIQPVWHGLIREGFDKYFIFKGRNNPQPIFDTHDILLTQVGQIATESRVIREGLLSGIPIVSGMANVDWTPFRHDCRDIDGYAAEIMKCWNSLRDTEKRRRLHIQNREFVCEKYDIRKSAYPLFQCYESIFNKSSKDKKHKPHEPSVDQSDGIDWDNIQHLIDDSDHENILEGILESLQISSDTMNKEEAVIRLLMDLHESG